MSQIPKTLTGAGPFLASQSRTCRCRNRRSIPDLPSRYFSDWTCHPTCCTSELSVGSVNLWVLYLLSHTGQGLIPLLHDNPSNNWGQQSTILYFLPVPSSLSSETCYADPPHADHTHLCVPHLIDLFFERMMPRLNKMARCSLTAQHIYSKKFQKHLLSLVFHSKSPSHHCHTVFLLDHITPQSPYPGVHFSTVAYASGTGPLHSSISSGHLFSVSLSTQFKS